MLLAVCRKGLKFSFLFLLIIIRDQNAFWWSSQKQPTFFERSGKDLLAYWKLRYWWYLMHHPAFTPNGEKTCQFCWLIFRLLLTWNPNITFDVLYARPAQIFVTYICEIESTLLLFWSKYTAGPQSNALSAPGGTRIAKTSGEGCHLLIVSAVLFRFLYRDLSHPVGTPG